MYSIIYHPIALIEYKDILSWYGYRSLDATYKFKIEFEEKINLIKREPLNYVNLYKDYYEIHLKKFPYTIVYKVKENSIIIIAVYHQKKILPISTGNLYYLYVLNLNVLC